MRLIAVKTSEVSGALPMQELTLSFDAPEHLRFLSIVWSPPINRFEFAEKVRSMAEMIAQTTELDQELAELGPR